MFIHLPPPPPSSLRNLLKDVFLENKGGNRRKDNLKPEMEDSSTPTPKISPWIKTAKPSIQIEHRGYIQEK